MKNSTIHSGHIAAPCHRGSLGQAQLARPTAKPLGWPMLLGCASTRTTRGGMVWPRPARPGWRAHHRLNDGGNSKILEEKRSRDHGLHTATQIPTQDARTTVLTVEAVATAEGGGVNGGTHTAMVTRSLDGPRSYTRPCRTLGKGLPAMRSTEEGAHQWMADVDCKILCRGWRGGACTTKARAK
jgi:hypothetical protein